MWCKAGVSGNVKPSEAHIELTKKLRKAGELMEMPIVDHLIVGDACYFSFADDGLI